MQIWTPNVDFKQAASIQKYQPKSTNKTELIFDNTHDDLPPFLFMEDCWLWPKIIYKVGLLTFKQLLVIDNLNYTYLSAFINRPCTVLKITDSFNHTAIPFVIDKMVKQDIEKWDIPPLVGILK